MSDTNSSPNNVDDAEIAKFEALAQRWWDKNGEFRPLHDMNPLRSNYINESAGIAGKTCIDVGCGGGILTESLVSLGAKEVIGIDMGQAPLSVAKLHAMENDVNVSYEKSTAEQMAVKKPEYYDLVCCLEMLEHVPDPSSVIQSCADMAKPGADLFFSTINRNPKSFICAIVGAEYILNVLPKGTHEYNKFIKPSELTRWLRAAGLELIEIQGILYNPIKKSFRLHPRDVDVNYIVHTRKIA